MLQPSSSARVGLRICPRCRKAYQEANFCPEDGAPLADGDPAVGTVLLDQIELQEVWGQGSMGTVYRAWQRQMERQVAVKVLHRDLVKDDQVVRRFRREAQAAARLSHPNIITVYLVGETDDGLPFIVMEFIRGRSLDTTCDEQAPLDVGRALQIARQIASALSEAHEHDIVHRDLKPANILLVDKRGMPDFVKVLDFGIAKLLSATDQSQITQTGTIFGTPYYLSPEQAAGDDVDHRSDLYSLGVMLFRMVTGKLPFPEPSAMDVLVQHIKAPPPRPTALEPGVPLAVEELILRLLAKAPDRRFQSAELLSTAIDALAEEIFGPAWAPRRDPTGPTPTPLPTEQTPVPDAPPPRPPPTAPGIVRPAAGPVALPPTATTLRGPAQVDGAAGSTQAMRRQVLRRRALLHLLLGVLSVAVGAGAGAILHHLRSAPESPRAALAPPSHEDAAAVRASADAAPDAATSRDLATEGAARPARRRRPRRPSGRRPADRRPRPRATRSRPRASRDASLPPRPLQPDASAVIAPLGPDPEIEGSDHDPDTKDEIYDLVE